jgi:hypothetical protein
VLRTQPYRLLAEMNTRVLIQHMWTTPAPKMFFLFLYLKICLLLLSTAYSSGSFGCLNEQGELVDWWVVYKESKGRRYVYTDSSQKGAPQGLSNSRLITDNKGPLVRTIRSAVFPTTPYYSSRRPFHLSWNDQTNKVTSKTSSAHAKVQLFL